MRAEVREGVRNYLRACLAMGTAPCGALLEHPGDGSLRVRGRLHPRVKSLRSIGAAITSCDWLMHLDFANNDLRARGTMLLCAAIVESRNAIRTLVLDENNIGDVMIEYEVSPCFCSPPRPPRPPPPPPPRPLPFDLPALTSSAPLPAAHRFGVAGGPLFHGERENPRAALPSLQDAAALARPLLQVHRHLRRRLHQPPPPPLLLPHVLLSPIPLPRQQQPRRRLPRLHPRCCCSWAAAQVPEPRRQHGQAASFLPHDRHRPRPRRHAHRHLLPHPPGPQLERLARGSSWAGGGGGRREQQPAVAAAGVEQHRRRRRRRAGGGAEVLQPDAARRLLQLPAGRARGRHGASNRKLLVPAAGDVEGKQLLATGSPAPPRRPRQAQGRGRETRAGGGGRSSGRPQTMGSGGGDGRNGTRRRRRSFLL
eukprot:765237-Hanusia_phi.AAC.2